MFPLKIQQKICYSQRKGVFGKLFSLKMDGEDISHIVNGLSMLWTILKFNFKFVQCLLEKRMMLSRLLRSGCDDEKAAYGWKLYKIYFKNYSKIFFRNGANGYFLGDKQSIVLLTTLVLPFRALKALPNTTKKSDLLSRSF